MDDLLLENLRISGFRAFRDLRIPRLGRVNLLVGKNSVGKSSVLEAIRVYAADAEADVFYRLEEERIGTTLPPDAPLHQVLEPLFHRPPRSGSAVGSHPDRQFRRE